MALALDGHIFNSFSSGFSNSVALTTTTGPDVILLFVQANSSSGSGTVTASSTTLGSFTQVAFQSNGSAYIALFAAIASSALSSESITLSDGGGYSFLTLQALGVSGAVTSSVAAAFDSGGPQFCGNAADPVSITTNNANTFVFGGYAMNIASATNGAGWTAIDLNSAFELSEYQIVSSAGLYQPTIGTGVGNCKQGLAVAVVASSAAPPQFIEGWASVEW